MTFPRIWPAGVAAAQELAPIEFETLDIDHTKSINGVDGDLAAGPLEFSDADLTGTSSIDISGQIKTSGNLEIDGDSTVQFLEVLGASEFTDPVTAFADVTSATFMSARSMLADRVVARAVGSQTIDTSTGAVLALDFTTRTTWIVTLNNGADPALPAVLGTISTLVDTSGTAELEVKPGTKISITFIAGAAQTGGIGLSPSVAVFPASFHGLTKADLVGPRSGANGVGGGTNDWMRIEIENIGTAGTPKYACKMTMGSG